MNLPARISWKPLPGSQTLAMSCAADIIFLDGTRGFGKTDAQLMRFRRRVGQGYGRHWRGVIFDREYKNLDDLVAKSMRWFPEIYTPGNKPKFLSSKSDYRWVWPTGEELLFRVVKRASDYWSYHGQEFPWIGWNELTKFATDELFDMMLSCNRSSFRPIDYPRTIDGDLFNRTGQIVFVDDRHRNAEQYFLPEMPLEVVATTNPFGVGHNWVKKRFVNIAPMGKIVRQVTNVFNPQTQRREDITRTQVRIFGSYRENKFLDPKYIATLENIKDKNKRKAWLAGSWDITAGGMFDAEWDSDYHIVKPFQIPHSWYIDRSFDWGSARPFSVGFWAESDGSDVQLPDGSWIGTVRGDLFRIGEWYGKHPDGKANVGLGITDSEIAKGIVEREIGLGLYGRVNAGPADGSIFDVKNNNSTAGEMRKSIRINGKNYDGINWARADKSSGSRIRGWTKIKEYLNGAIPTFTENGHQLPREKPGMFIFNTCVDFIDLFPSLPRDEKNLDDVDTDAEDHIGDETRYKILDVGTGGRVGKTKGL